MNADEALRLAASLEERRIDALVQGDWAEIERLYSDDLTYVHSIGLRETKEQHLTLLRSGALVYHRISIQLDSAVASAATVWATGSTTSELTGGGTTRQLTSFVSVLWQNDDARWRLRAFQATAAVTANPITIEESEIA
ncbi:MULTISPECIES: nuclear transport factor 2 family protein [Microbacterium]|uniref:DUF4440 domain-containing protein n=1 Tax=Microbacterium saccharophilum TaxID=1213358 RepID=A0A7Z7D0G0_9MICO|nr:MULTISPECIES: nuclear transport factor 2 family protein [Microbacterium]SFI61553.1 protein of unknown function [Microbacterium saccharophilum]